MIAKPEWFKRRKYGGWGLTPATKEGWIYIAVMMLPLLIFQIFNWNTQIRFVVTTAWILFLVVDIILAMTRLKIDEREKKIESISERNAAWAMVFAIAVLVLFDLINGALNSTFYVNPQLVIILGAGLLAKAVSNIVVERKKL